jgi:lysozyme family protein
LYFGLVDPRNEIARRRVARRAGRRRPEALRGEAERAAERRRHETVLLGRIQAALAGGTRLDPTAEDDRAAADHVFKTVYRPRLITAVRDDPARLTEILSHIAADVSRLGLAPDGLGGLVAAWWASGEPRFQAGAARLHEAFARTVEPTAADAALDAAAPLGPALPDDIRHRINFAARLIEAGVPDEVAVKRAGEIEVTLMTETRTDSSTGTTSGDQANVEPSSQDGEAQAAFAEEASGANDQVARANPGGSGATIDPVRAQATFREFRQRLGPMEGGFADRGREADPRGPTMKGISQDTLDGLRKRREWAHLPSESRDLTDGQIDDIYRKEFFERPQIGRLEQVPGLAEAAPRLAEQMFDAGVLHGPEEAGKWLQEALDERLGTDLRGTNKRGERVYDGIIGSRARAAVEEAVLQGKIGEINDAIVDRRIEYMRSLPNFYSNPGWIPRAQSFRMRR